MKRFLFATALLMAVHTAQADSLSIRADNWFPMNGDPKAAQPGYMIELATEIMQTHNISIDYQNMPWERAVQMVREGKIDCVVGAYKGDAPDLQYPTEDWGRETSAVFVKSDNSWTFQGQDSLAGQKVGVISGYSYGDDANTFIKAHCNFPTYRRPNTPISFCFPSHPIQYL